jgi:ABC-type phosphate transport system substrate-binding protein
MTRAFLAATAAAAALSTTLAQAQTTTINAGGSSASAPTYISEFETYTSANPTSLFSYEAVGSGAGQSAFLTNNITLFSNYPAGTLTYGTIVGSTVHMGASDAFLSASQLTNPATGSYGLSPTDGPLIQLPADGVGIALSYNYPSITKLRLTDTLVCGILSGKLTNWNQIVKTGSGVITVVYRSDSSGTTFLLTQHLNAVCTSANSTFPTLPVPITKTFASLFPNSTPPTNFIGESGAANVASTELATAESFGAITPDFTSLAPKSSNATSLQVAFLQNPGNGTYYQPTVANIELGLANPGAGSTNPSPPSTLANAQNPLNWIPSIPVTTQGYGILGYGTLLLSSCYADKTAGSILISFLHDNYFTKSYQTIIQNNGFAPLPDTAASPFATAVQDDFLSNKSDYHLDIDDKTTCKSYPGR